MRPSDRYNTVRGAARSVPAMPAVGYVKFGSDEQACRTLADTDANSDLLSAAAFHMSQVSDLEEWAILAEVNEIMVDRQDTEIPLWQEIQNTLLGVTPPGGSTIEQFLSEEHDFVVVDEKPVRSWWHKIFQPTKTEEKQFKEGVGYVD